MKNNDKSSLETDLSQGAFGKISGFTYSRSVKGIKEFTVKARSAVYFEKEGRADFKEADIAFYENNEQKGTLTASEGTVFTKENNIEAKGGVVVKSSEGYTAKTEKLYYRAMDREIYTDAPVVIEGEKAYIRGVGLEMNIRNQKLVLLNNVRGFLVR